MRILEENLRTLLGGLGISPNNSLSTTFPQLPKDNRLRLVPKEVEEEKLIMYKEGDKMRIPGVLDYTGAKYPFKKIRKGKDGLDIGWKWENPVGNYSTFQQYTDFSNYPNPESGYTVTFTDKEKKGYNNNVYGKSIRLRSDKEHPNEFMIIMPKVSKDLGRFFSNQLLGDLDALASLYELLNPIADKQIKGVGKVDISDTLNNRLSKLKLLFEWSGNPTFDTKDKRKHYGVIEKNRPHIDIGKKTYLRGNNYSSLSKLINELSHHYQVNNSISKKFGIDSTLIGLIGGDIQDMNGETGYQRWGGNEFNAHEIIQPAMYEFVLNKKYKTEEDFINLLKDNYIKAAKKYYTPENELRRRTTRAKNAEYENERLNALLISMNKGGLFAKSGIKIKKKNRGKFTAYCGGNVTQECINRAKHSGNKRLVKRAVFAENARKWKK